MLINQNPDVRPVFTKGRVSVIKSVINKEIVAGVAQEINCTATIIGPGNVIEATGLPVSINVVSLYEDSRPSISNQVAYVELSLNLQYYTGSLAGGENYIAVFELSYLEDDVVVEAYSTYNDFKVIDDVNTITAIIDNNQEITRELLNEKMAGIATPGVLYGMQVSLGSGTGMLNIKPGAAIARNGTKYEIKYENYNVVKLLPLPDYGTRVDLLVIKDVDDKAHFEIVPSDPILAQYIGQEYIRTQEDDQTVIAYLYSRSTMASEAETIIVPRLSVEMMRPYKRIIGEDLTSQINGTTREFILKNAAIDGQYTLYLDDKRVHPSKVYMKNNRTLSFIPSENAPAAPSTLVCDYSQTQPLHLYDDDIANYHKKDIVISQAAPWSDCEILYNNATLNAAEDISNHIINWTNKGTLTFDSSCNFSRYSPTSSPFAIRNGNGVKLPIDNINLLDMTVNMNGNSTKPHTLMLKAEISQVTNEALMLSNALEGTSMSDFGVAVNNANPLDPFFSITHCGLLLEDRVHFAANTPVIFTFILAANNNVRVLVNDAEIYNGAAALTTNIVSFSQIYLKNLLGPTIYWLGYWGREISQIELNNMIDGLLSNNIV